MDWIGMSCCYCFFFFLIMEEELLVIFLFGEDDLEKIEERKKLKELRSLWRKVIY